MDDDIKNLTKSVDAIAQTTAKILETMVTKEDLVGFATKKDLENFATKKDLENFATKKDWESLKFDLTSFKLETNLHFNNLETDLKSFKEETKENFAEVNEKIDDLSDTVMGFDKRIEILEEKVV